MKAALSLADTVHVSESLEIALGRADGSVHHLTLIEGEPRTLAHLRDAAWMLDWAVTGG